MSPSINLKRVLFLGRKPGASRALIHLIQEGIEVSLVVAPTDSELQMAANQHQIKTISDDSELYRLISTSDPLVADIDLVISYLFPKRIRKPLFLLGKLGCLNFHPAPLPDYKNRAGYNTAILDQRMDYGVSVHYIDSDEFDAGPIIEVLRFPIDPERETALSLERTAQEKLLELFQITIARFARGETILTLPNVGGQYLTSRKLEALKLVDPNCDSPEVIHRKIRAFFFPPFSGAYIIVGGQKFTLVNQEIMDWLARVLNSLSHR